MTSGAMKSAARVLRDAVIATVAFSAIGLAFNALRSEGLPLVATQAYEVFVPCPEPLGEVDPVRPGDPVVRDSRTLRVDARSPREYADWHLADSVNVPFDYLDEVSQDNARLVARSGAARVVVYGDGLDPDSGRELARELAGRGIRNVFFVEGGAPVLQSPGEAGKEGLR